MTKNDLVVILFGAPGSGKGTQASILAETSGLRHISTGDLLRDHIARGTEVGRLALEAQRVGAYVNDETMIAMIREELHFGGIILDGFPRTVPQAVALDALLAEKGKVAVPILLEVPTERLKERITGRRIHPPSGRIYHLEFAPPLRDGLDDVTDEPLICRPDDAEHLVQARLDVYDAKTTPVLVHYPHLVRLNADRDAENVAQNLAWTIEKALLPNHLPECAWAGTPVSPLQSCGCVRIVLV